MVARRVEAALPLNGFEPLRSRGFPDRGQYVHRVSGLRAGVRGSKGVTVAVGDQNLLFSPKEHLETIHKT